MYKYPFASIMILLISVFCFCSRKWAVFSVFIGFVEVFEFYYGIWIKYYFSLWYFHVFCVLIVVFCNKNVWCEMFLLLVQMFCFWKLNLGELLVWSLVVILCMSIPDRPIYSVNYSRLTIWNIDLEEAIFECQIFHVYTFLKEIICSVCFNFWKRL